MPFKQRESRPPSRNKGRRSTKATIKHFFGQDGILAGDNTSYGALDTSGIKLIQSFQVGVEARAAHDHHQVVSEPSILSFTNGF